MTKKHPTNMFDLELRIGYDFHGTLSGEFYVTSLLQNLFRVSSDLPENAPVGVKVVPPGKGRYYTSFRAGVISDVFDIYSSVSEFRDILLAVTDIAVFSNPMFAAFLVMDNFGKINDIVNVSFALEYAQTLARIKPDSLVVMRETAAGIALEFTYAAYVAAKRNVTFKAFNLYIGMETIRYKVGEIRVQPLPVLGTDGTDYVIHGTGTFASGYPLRDKYTFPYPEIPPPVAHTALSHNSDYVEAYFQRVSQEMIVRGES